MVVAVTNADDIERMLPWTRTLAAKLRLPVTLAYMLDPGHERTSVDIAAAMAQDLVALAATDPRLDGLTVTARVLVGLQDEELPELAAREPGAWLMMLGSTQGVVRSVLGSTSDSTLHALTTPVIVLPPHTIPPREVRQVVVGTDHSAPATVALDVARGVAALSDIEVVEVEVIGPGAAFAASVPVFERGRIVMRGRPAPTLVAVARARGAALIAVGSHGGGGLATRVLGSTAEWLTHHADRPVLVVPTERNQRP